METAGRIHVVGANLHCQGAPWTRGCQVPCQTGSNCRCRPRPADSATFVSHGTSIRARQLSLTNRT